MSSWVLNIIVKTQKTLPAGDTSRQGLDDEPISSVECPVCHQSNECTAQQIDACWCQQHKFSVELMDALKRRNITDACICVGCLQKFNKSGSFVDMT